MVPALLAEPVDAQCTQAKLAQDYFCQTSLLAFLFAFASLVWALSGLPCLGLRVWSLPGICARLGVIVAIRPLVGRIPGLVWISVLPILLMSAFAVVFTFALSG